MPSKNTPKYDAYSDACGVEELRVRQEKALAMGHARMLLAVSAPDGMLPLDLEEDVDTQAGKAPFTKRQAVELRVMRDKMDYVLVHYGIVDLMGANEDPYTEEDQMTEDIVSINFGEEEVLRSGQFVDSYNEDVGPEDDRVPFDSVVQASIDASADSAEAFDAAMGGELEEQYQDVYGLPTFKPKDTTPWKKSPGDRQLPAKKRSKKRRSDRWKEAA